MGETQITVYENLLYTNNTCEKHPFLVYSRKSYMYTTLN